MGMTAGGAERERRSRERKAAARAGVVPDQAVQLPLAGVALEPDGPREGGRPAGSVARATAEWRGLILSRYRSPLIGLAETYSRPVADLARELGCTPYEAFQIQVKAMVELGPYLHGKMPTAIQLDGVPMVAVGVSVTPAMAAMLGVAAGMKIEEYQDVKPEGGE